MHVITELLKFINLLNAHQRFFFMYFFSRACNLELWYCPYPSSLYPLSARSLFSINSLIFFKYKYFILHNPLQIMHICVLFSKQRHGMQNKLTVFETTSRYATQVSNTKTWSRQTNSFFLNMRSGRSRCSFLKHNQDKQGPVHIHVFVFETWGLPSQDTCCWNMTKAYWARNCFWNMRSVSKTWPGYGDPSIWNIRSARSKHLILKHKHGMQVHVLEM